MSLFGYKRFIKLDDTVILYLSNNLYTLEVKKEIKNKKGEWVENVFQTPYGALKVKNLVGIEYGSKVQLSKGWAHVIQPTPELWTLCLPHRTQIVYTPDISMILTQLELGPGKICVEAGTGSGSLTHALIRRIIPDGHVFTFDFHKQRVELAQSELQNHGLKQFVTVKQRDILEDGFGDDLDGKVDAVFLDLPKPWLGIPFAKRAFKKNKGGRLASFSPCIEQVQRTCEALRKQGYQDVVIFEVLQTEIKVQERSILVRDLDFLKIRSSENPVTEKAGLPAKYVSGSWPANTPGHTGYLTFATFPPIRKRPISDGTEILIKQGKLYLFVEGQKRFKFETKDGQPLPLLPDANGASTSNVSASDASTSCASNEAGTIYAGACSANASDAITSNADTSATHDITSDADPRNADSSNATITNTEVATITVTQDPEVSASMEDDDSTSEIDGNPNQEIETVLPVIRYEM